MTDGKAHAEASKSEVPKPLGTRRKAEQITLLEQSGQIHRGGISQKMRRHRTARGKIRRNLGF